MTEQLKKLAKKYGLKPYSIYAKDGIASVLVFAHSFREAKVIAFRDEFEGLEDYEFVDLRGHLIKGENGYNPYDTLTNTEDIIKLESGVPFSTCDVVFCKLCEKWEAPIGDDGLCDECRKSNRRQKCITKPQST